MGAQKSTYMGRKGPRAKTKTVLKPVKQWEKHGSMPNSEFFTFLNKNHPTTHSYVNKMVLFICILKGMSSSLKTSWWQGITSTGLNLWIGGPAHWDICWWQRWIQYGPWDFFLTPQFWKDPQLEQFSTGLGTVRFLQLIGVSEEELKSVQR